MHSVNAVENHRTGLDGLAPVNIMPLVDQLRLSPHTASGIDALDDAVNPTALREVDDDRAVGQALNPNLSHLGD